MRIILNNQDKTKALVLAETENDREALNIFFKSKIIFGLYQIWLKGKNGEGENRPEIKPYLEKVPTLTGIGWLNLVKGFVPTKLIT